MSDVQPAERPSSPANPVNTFGRRPLPGTGGRPSRLGRGLDSLIPAAGGRVPQQVPLEQIGPNPSQPRRAFDEEELQALAASITAHGMLQPLVVRPLKRGRYQLIAGERRWRAAKLAWQETAPIVVQEKGGTDAEEQLALALVENLQRVDLNPIELATAFEQLSASGWTQKGIARGVSKSRAAVANLLRLRRLPDAVQDLIAAGALSEGHGRALLGAPAAEQAALAERAVASGWTVRRLEEAAQALASASTAAESPRRRPAVRPAVVLDAVQRLESALGTRVEVRARSSAAGGGRIVVHWQDEAQLAALAAQISGGAPRSDALDAVESGD